MLSALVRHFTARGGEWELSFMTGSVDPVSALGCCLSLNAAEKSRD
jgi:hypothetical protein